MDKLRIEHDEEGDWHILRLSGCADASTFVLLEQALSEAVESGCHNLRLDLQNLHDINSTGLGLLLAAHRQVRQRGNTLVIDNKMNDKMADFFNALGFSKLMADNQEQGLARVPAK